MPLLTQQDLATALVDLPDWIRTGNEIRKTFVHKDFVRAMGFVGQVGILAERADHHPDIDIRWNKVTLTLSTHSAGGLTDKDIALAKEIEGL